MTHPTPPLRSYNALWFLLRALIPMTVLGLALLALSGLAAGGGPAEFSTLLLRISGGLVLSIAVVVMVSVRARRAAAESGLEFGATRIKSAGRGLLMGAAIWLVPAGICFTALTFLGAPLTIDAPLGKVLSVGFLVFMAVLLSEAVPEELVFRGQLMSVLSEKLQGWWVIVVQAGLFTAFAVMLRGWTGVADFSLFLGMGIGLGYMRAVAGSVWTTVGFHAVFQTGSQLFLTHEVATFAGSEAAAMIALGALPFAFGAIFVALLAPKRPNLFVSRQ